MRVTDLLVVYFKHVFGVGLDLVVGEIIKFILCKVLIQLFLNV